jgi:protein SCO1/2
MRVEQSRRSSQHACAATASNTQRVGAALCGAALLVLATACGGAAPDASALRGVVLSPGVPRPIFTLTATNGQAYDFFRRTAGRLTFLYFGYTSCPDVCPLQMANLAAVLNRLSFEDRRKVTVVFVTVDPARDSAAHLRRWLDQFDHAFVGLRGPVDSLDRIEAALHLAPAVVQSSRTDSNYTVGHAAEMLVFTPDDSTHLVYPFGTRQRDLAHDLPLLLRASTVHAE